MSLLINSHNSAPHPLTGGIQEPQRALSSEDFLSRAIHIVKTGTQEGHVEQIDVPLQALRQKYAGEPLSLATCRALIEKIKNTDVCTQHLPTIYRHLILDLRLRVDDLSTCNEEFRIAKARLDAQEDGWGVSEDIQKYGITSESDLVEIAKLAAQQNGRKVSEFIQNYRIKSEAARVEIAKLAAQQNGEEVSRYIQNYGITSEETLIEIAKLAAQQSGEGASRYIQNYGIKSEEARVEIAKIVAKRHGPGVSEYIQNYEIKSKETLIEIAMIAAQQDDTAISQYIQNYGIENEEILIEIAKLAAQQDGRQISKYIRNYRIKNEAALVEIVMIAAKVDSRAVSEYIQNYGIKTEATRVEIAKLAAQQDGEAVSECIQNYDIKIEAARVEIAKIVAQQDGKAISGYIQNYGITNQETLIEIAKLAAQQSDEGISIYIQNYAIKSEAARVEIAKLAARQSGRGISLLIQNYDIKSQEALIEIGTLAIRKSGLYAIYFINNCNLDPMHRATLIARCVNRIPEILQNISSYFPEQDHGAILKQYPELRMFGINDNHVSEYFYLVSNFSDKRINLYLEMAGETDPAIKALKMNRLRAFCSISDVFAKSPSLLQKFSSLFASIEAEKDPHIQEQKLTLLAAFIMHCRASNVNKTALDEQFSLFREVFDLKDPALRCYLTDLFAENLTNPVLCGFIKKNLTSIQSKKNECATADLTLLLLAPLIVDVDPYVEFRITKKKLHLNPEDILPIAFIKRLQELLNHSYFKRDRIRTKSLLRGLRVLVDSPQLSNEQKTAILRDLIFNRGDLILFKDENFSQKQKQYCEQLFRSVEIVGMLSACNQSDRLTSITAEQLPNQIPELFKSVLNIDIPDCNKRVLETFASWRKPDALLTYAGNLESLPMQEKEPVLSLLKKYAEGVLKGTFASDRYDGAKASEHWLKVLEKMPLTLIEKWKKGSSYVDNGFDVVDTDNPCDLLLSGTEMGSCQRVDGAPQQSKCLVAYLMDPKIRMMAVKNKQGVTIARCMMRLLWDKRAHKFVLFQEKKYPNNGDPSFAKMLDRACKKRAQEIGLALLAKDTEAQEGEKTTLQAFKGKAPFEYVDAYFDPIQTDVGYELPGCVYIYQPDNFKST